MLVLKQGFGNSWAKDQAEESQEVLITVSQTGLSRESVHSSAAFGQQVL